MENSKIYALIDPTTSQARWVGRTSTRLCNRLSAHCTTARGAGGKKMGCTDWIADLLARGHRPEIVTLELAKDWEEAEQFWIGYFRFMGADLLNISPGGYIVADETKRKLGGRQKGKRRPEHVIAAISAAHRGVPKSEDQKQKIAASLRGRKIPDAVRDKISTSLAGRRLGNHTRESIERQAAKLRGRKQDPEANARRSATLKATLAAKRASMGVH